MLDKAKQLYQLQKKAKEVQKTLKNTEIEARSADSMVSAVFSGDQKIKSIDIDQSLLAPEKKKELEEKLIRVISEGLSRSQAVAAEKAKSLMGDMGMNIPGL
ncbi:MAG: Nucleoid-associated protein [candidate division WS2 bacterium ADurb.Bin280]|uniref:Nucleoid-associated protein n=1 Tax=candidate division WS2 bacterium ADurb.Bin280 TaxID=1852829 RepID=A0A1V5SDZ3_9BACT|nr:MAG: Nucleoid-associated protein [candidate division WS2 bacterium ADurb.Bin280]